jgi:hypothetical protein
VRRGVLLTTFHKDVDVVSCLGEVNELDNVWMFYLLAYQYFRLNPFDYVHFQLLLRCFIALLLGDLNGSQGTCLSSSILDIILHARGREGLPLGQAAKT